MRNAKNSVATATFVGALSFIVSRPARGCSFRMIILLYTMSVECNTSYTQKGLMA
jgi:hypothetical protein